MIPFRVVPIPTAVAQSVRETGKAPVYGFPAHKEIATGRAPCRHCLRLIRVQEEELLLFTYDPFRELGEAPLPGPVYIHADKCELGDGHDSFPEEYRGRSLTLIAYGDERKQLHEKRVSAGNEDAEAENLFADAAVRYIHVRSTEAGCYLFRLERGTNQ
ncbi:MAG TPA: DUF1203 domain-containing protein [Candidatus Sulfotelmatobacter sp.]|nr:DUF1203 domain-containing protein [Candidatus Sulfotelmatobacter sp.]